MYQKGASSSDSDIEIIEERPPGKTFKYSAHRFSELPVSSFRSVAMNSTTTAPQIALFRPYIDGADRIVPAHPFSELPVSSFGSVAMNSTTTAPQIALFRPFIDDAGRVVPGTVPNRVGQDMGPNRGYFLGKYGGGPNGECFGGYYAGSSGGPGKGSYMDSVSRIYGLGGPGKSFNQCASSGFGGFLPAGTKVFGVGEGFAYGFGTTGDLDSGNSAYRSYGEASSVRGFAASTHIREELAAGVAGIPIGNCPPYNYITDDRGCSMTDPPIRGMACGSGSNQKHEQLQSESLKFDGSESHPLDLRMPLYHPNTAPHTATDRPYIGGTEGRGLAVDPDRGTVPIRPNREQCQRESPESDDSEPEPDDFTSAAPYYPSTAPNIETGRPYNFDTGRFGPGVGPDRDRVDMEPYRDHHYRALFLQSHSGDFMQEPQNNPGTVPKIGRGRSYLCDQGEFVSVKVPDRGPFHQGFNGGPVRGFGRGCGAISIGGSSGGGYVGSCDREYGFGVPVKAFNEGHNSGYGGGRATRRGLFGEDREPNGAHRSYYQASSNHGFGNSGDIVYGRGSGDRRHGRAPDDRDCTANIREQGEYGAGAAGRYHGNSSRDGYGTDNPGSGIRDCSRHMMTEVSRADAAYGVAGSSRGNSSSVGNGPDDSGCAIRDSSRNMMIGVSRMDPAYETQPDTEDGQSVRVLSKNRRITIAVRLKIIELAHLGMKHRDIARSLDVSRSSVSKILRRYRSTRNIFALQGGRERKRTIQKRKTARHLHGNMKLNAYNGNQVPQKPSPAYISTEHLPTKTKINSRSPLSFIPRAGPSTQSSSNLLDFSMDLQQPTTVPVLPETNLLNRDFLVNQISQNLCNGNQQPQQPSSPTRLTIATESGVPSSPALTWPSVSSSMAFLPPTVAAVLFRIQFPQFYASESQKHQMLKSFMNYLHKRHQQQSAKVSGPPALQPRQN